MVSNLRRLAPALVVAIGLAQAGPAWAQEAAPVPDCAGVQAKDGTGDNPLFGQAAAPAGPENTDITQVFFRVIAGADGKKALAVDVGVVNLDKETIPGTTATRWTTYITVDDVSFRAYAELSAAGAVKFFYTTPNVIGGAINVPTNNETSGRFVEGANGVVEIHIPLDVVPVGKKLTAMYVETRGVIAATPAGTTGPLADRAPDSGEMKNYTVTECAAEAPPAPTGVPAAPAAEQPAPAPAPSESGPAPAAAGQQSTGPPPAKPASKSSAAYKKCVKKAKKLKNTRKRSAALKRCKKKRR